MISNGRRMQLFFASIRRTAVRLWEMHWCSMAQYECPMKCDHFCFRLIAWLSETPASDQSVNQSINQSIDWSYLQCMISWLTVSLKYIQYSLYFVIFDTWPCLCLPLYSSHEWSGDENWSAESSLVGKWRESLGTDVLVRGLLFFDTLFAKSGQARELPSRYVILLHPLEFLQNITNQAISRIAYSMMFNWLISRVMIDPIMKPLEEKINHVSQLTTYNDVEPHSGLVENSYLPSCSIGHVFSCCFL